MWNVIHLMICHFLSLYFQGLCKSLFGPVKYIILGKETLVKWIVKRVKIIVFFIQQHHAPLAILFHYESDIMFQNPIEIQFVTNFFTIE